MPHDSHLLESPWAVGQRVRNEAEPSLGLGVVEGQPTPRSLAVFFPAAGERRLYNPRSAPLRRFELGVGQPGRTRDGRAFRVERVALGADGLLTYHGQGLVVPEGELEDASASHDPLQRLLAGELSDHTAFDLRANAWRLRSCVLQQRSRGLSGARVSLLPHQLAIAHRVASREFPRVLLADEVGLGKTIEAGLIFAALRALGRAERVLVLTPASLANQWFVELYRRFNAVFALPQAEWGDEPLTENPFDGATRAIVPLDWVLERDRLAFALEQPWDLVIVDEAHHLGWSCAGVTPQYAAVEALARQSQGLLLLTATPLRQGLETEFGLLRLVDGERFADFARFEAEQAHLRDVAALARRLHAGEDVASELRRLYPEARWDGPPAEALAQLIDRHGTGRVLMRNRREKLGGFPGRALHVSRLPLPERWQKARAWPELVALQRLRGLPEAKGPEPTAQDDPRTAWLLAQLRALGDQKAVVMASTVEQVKALEKLLKRESGLEVAVFHEQLGLLERDRQAAYFADPEGAQVLVSSEIGGEGRNFQFCHHLLLVDLPVHPDALEQRIGRLDRIGQTETIHVHVPVIEGTPGEALFAWHRALGVFDAPLTGGEAMLEAQALRLLAVLAAHTPGNRDAAGLDAFVQETAELFARQRAEVQASVDFLIDLNSFDQALGNALIGEIGARDGGLLESCVSDLLEHFGVVEDDLADARVRRIQPGDLMKVDAFPGLRADGYLATYDRALALAREDMQFLSPDHPLVEGALALLLDQAEGRASVARWPGADAAGVRVEFLFLLEAVGPERLALARFLPPTALKLTRDLQGRACASAQDAGVRLDRLNPQLWPRLAGFLQDPLPPLLEAAEAAANTELQEHVEAALARAEAVLGAEQQRLEALHRLGNVPLAELAAHADTLEATRRCLREARVGLDAVRVVLLEPGV